MFGVTASQKGSSCQCKFSAFRSKHCGNGEFRPLSILACKMAYFGCRNGLFQVTKLESFIKEKQEIMPRYRNLFVSLPTNL